jgi:phosphatidate cytidylyltransferase
MLRKKKSNAMTEPNATATEPTIQTSNDTFKGIETQQLTTKESISKSNSGETTQYENTNVATTSATASTDVTNSDSNVQQQHPSYSQQQQQQQHKSKSLHESNLHKIASRAVTATALFSIFYTSVSMGHVYISALVALIELLLFRELVRVRYNAHFDKIQNKIPLFRTTQWCWFAVSIFYTYSDFCIDMMQRNEQWHVWLRRFFHYVPTMTFWMYAVTFVLTIKTLQTGHIKFQMNQLCWTIVVICVTVGQLK